MSKLLIITELWVHKYSSLICCGFKRESVILVSLGTTNSDQTRHKKHRLLKWPISLLKIIQPFIRDCYQFTHSSKGRMDDFDFVKDWTVLAEALTSASSVANCTFWGQGWVLIWVGGKLLMKFCSVSCVILYSCCASGRSTLSNIRRGWKWVTHVFKTRNDSDLPAPFAKEQGCCTQLLRPEMNSDILRLFCLDFHCFLWQGFKLYS